MTGREDSKANDLFYTCSLIDYIARKTKNKRSTACNSFGRASVSKIYECHHHIYSNQLFKLFSASSLLLVIIPSFSQPCISLQSPQVSSFLLIAHCLIGQSESQ